jgi:hypothetical protein
MITKHEECILNFYKSKNVGESITERFLFWENSEHKSNFSRNISEDAKVSCYETQLLATEFPGDFHWV